MITSAALIRAWSPTGTFLGNMPDFGDLRVQHEHCQPGTLTFKYDPNGLNADLLNEPILWLSVYQDGREGLERYALGDDSLELTGGVNGDAMISVTARGLLADLESAVVYPGAHTAGANPNGMEPEHAFTDVTPGAILATLLQRAQARGAIPAFTWDFTDTHDSAGMAWRRTRTVTYRAGRDYLSVLADMHTSGWVDYVMGGDSGTVLHVYELDTVLARDLPDQILRTSQCIESGPQNRSRKGVATTVLGWGEEKAAIELTDAAATATLGRREAFVSNTQMTYLSNITDLAQRTLEESARLTDAITLKVLLDPPAGESWPEPNVTFRTGDYIRWDKRRLSPTELEPLRVQSITFGWDSSDAPRRCEVELNDVILDPDVDLARKVDDLGAGLGGLAGAYNSAGGWGNGGWDSSVPSPPTITDVQAVMYVMDDVPEAFYEIDLTWAMPTTNTDGTPLSDLKYCESYFEITDGEVHGPRRALYGRTHQSWTRMPMGHTGTVAVRAVDDDGNESEWATAPVSLPALGPGMVDGWGSMGRMVTFLKHAVEGHDTAAVAMEEWQQEQDERLENLERRQHKEAEREAKQDTDIAEAKKRAADAENKTRENDAQSRKRDSDLEWSQRALEDRVKAQEVAAAQAKERIDANAENVRAARNAAKEAADQAKQAQERAGRLEETEQRHGDAIQRAQDAADQADRRAREVAAAHGNARDRIQRLEADAETNRKRGDSIEQWAEDAKANRESDRSVIDRLVEGFGEFGDGLNEGLSKLWENDGWILATKPRLNALESGQSNLTSRIGAAETAVSSLNTQVGGLTSRVGTLESGLDGVRSDVSSLTWNFGELKNGNTATNNWLGQVAALASSSAQSISGLQQTSSWIVDSWIPLASGYISQNSSSAAAARYVADGAYADASRAQSTANGARSAADNAREAAAKAQSQAWVAYTYANALRDYCSQIRNYLNATGGNVGAPPPAPGFPSG